MCFESTKVLNNYAYYKIRVLLLSHYSEKQDLIRIPSYSPAHGEFKNRWYPHVVYSAVDVNKSVVISSITLPSYVYAQVIRRIKLTF